MKINIYIFNQRAIFDPRDYTAGNIRLLPFDLPLSMLIQTVVKTSKNSLIEAGQFIAKITETSAEHQENLTIFFLKPPCPNGHRKTWFLIYFSKTFTHR